VHLGSAGHDHAGKRVRAILLRGAGLEGVCGESLRCGVERVADPGFGGHPVAGVLAMPIVMSLRPSRPRARRARKGRCPDPRARGRHRCGWVQFRKSAAPVLRSSSVLPRLIHAPCRRRSARSAGPSPAEVGNIPIAVSTPSGRGAGARVMAGRRPRCAEPPHRRRHAI